MGEHIGLPGRSQEVARAYWQQYVEIDGCLIQNPAYRLARAKTKNSLIQMLAFESGNFLFQITYVLLLFYSHKLLPLLALLSECE